MQWFYNIVELQRPVQLLQENRFLVIFCSVAIDCLRRIHDVRNGRGEIDLGIFIQ